MVKSDASVRRFRCAGVLLRQAWKYRERKKNAYYSKSGYCHLRNAVEIRQLENLAGHFSKFSVILRIII